MNITIISKIPDKTAASVFAGFDENLFRYLSPAYPHLKINRFDGCQKGDKVVVTLGILPGLKLTWQSEITEFTSEGNHFFSFTDRGSILPFFISFWQHEHIIRQQNADVIIEDRISYKGRSFTPALISYPMLWISFNSRKSKYRRYFAQG